MLVLPENPIGIQLYTVREAARDDFAGTLRRLAQGGFRAVEFAGYGGMAIRELRALLRELDLRVAGSHIPLADFEERLAVRLAEVVELGGEYAVVPWVPEVWRGSLDAARQLAANLNTWAVAARDAGLGFAYHHHAFEFDPLPGGNGATLFDIITAETDPHLVGIELDVYWAAHAGVDPAHLLQELQGRVPLLHLKDLGAGADRPDLPAGEGILRWEEILTAAMATGTRWWIVEQDNPAEPIADAIRALRNIEGMG
ncbi:MAG: sugar phosphate isomerase/epimerase [Thermomicrobiales bacterium]|nr:sugar phosphate isomerase/epimerase [Thermomicrobiales bacterium]